LLAKVVDPAQPSSQAHSFSDWPSVRVNVGQSSELGGVDQQEQACFEPDPKGKAIAQPNFQVLSSSDWLSVRSDAGQSSDLEASTSSGVPPAVLRSSLLSGNSLSVGGPVGPAVSPDPVVLMSVVTIGESMEVMSPAKVLPELNQAVSKSRVDSLADLSQEPTDILRAVSEGRDRMSRLFGPCSGGVGGGSFAWQGNFSGELVVSRLNGWGLPLKPLQNYLFMQAKDGVGNSNSHPTRCSDLVVFQEGDQPKAVADSEKVLWDVDVGEREGKVGLVSPLNSYTNS